MWKKYFKRNYKLTASKIVFEFSRTFFQTSNFLLFQDPRLLSDAYLTTGQYTRVENGVESPTYIQLENASVARPGYSGIYSPPVTYRQDYTTNDHHIYSVKSATNNAR